MYCPLDGCLLVEATLGLLVCPKCETQYLPTLNDLEGTQSLTWLEKL